ncbi:MAG: biotin--[acetyl-CoA-carboxylase] ligase [Armatimonadota bacterium]|nr:biotin--[acetyl-CoA-carboxylase] ligase [Armatimonadota bacterium]MDR7486919.1 biotin--[acetyl-CoA-carboxylase] ligase [Armatimonadota bacterium]MDR7534537.1 biotin--[acetyl-CoA-carboxylase] ligase [Armatimonadota bacterium]MDR7537630.1 biotin--[acetyl-CoA-carboxylase] ligase [Armatimonadota bacterium]
MTAGPSDARAGPAQDLAATGLAWDLPTAAAAGLGRPLVRVGETESTNDLARRLADAGLPEGTTVVAVRQTRGRGRLGRAWASPEGGLWCSVLLRPPPGVAWTLLSLATALAVAEAVEAVGGVRASLRWPNDVLVHGRKVSGILLEATGSALVVGVGINANVRLDALPPEVRAGATSLAVAAGRPVDLEALRVAFLRRLAVWYDAWRAAADVPGAWAARDALAGRRVVVRTSGEVVEGTGEGVADDGALRVRLASGEVRRVLAGDLVGLEVRGAHGP